MSFEVWFNFLGQSRIGDSPNSTKTHSASCVPRVTSLSMPGLSMCDRDGPGALCLIQWHLIQNQPSSDSCISTTISTPGAASSLVFRLHLPYSLGLVINDSFSGRTSF